MQIFSSLVALLFAALEVQAVAVPAKALRDSDNVAATPNVTVTFITANGTRLNATPGTKLPQVNFIPTASTQTVCSRTNQMGDMQGNYARSADCQSLADFVKTSYLGYWDTWDYDGLSLGIINAGTCTFYISGVETFGGHVWIGNQDVGDAASAAIAAYTHSDGLIAAAGQFNCNHPSGASVLNWFLERDYTQ